MIRLIDPRMWLALVLVSLAGYFGGQWQENRVSTARLELVNSKAKIELAAATARAEVAEKKLKDGHAAIDETLKKEKEDAKVTIDALRADVRRGAVSLSIATRALRAGAGSADPTVGYIETRAELVPEAAVALIDIAADGNSAVLELNACIDKYHAVEQASKSK